MHPTDGELLLSTEPEGHADGSRVRSHLAACSSCTARLEALLSDLEQVASSLTVLDGTVPAVGARAVMERARSSSTRSAPPSALPRIPARAAAVVALLVLAGAAAALPGSPVRRWLTQRSVQTNPAAAPVQDAPTDEGFAGVALTSDAALEVRIPENVLQGTVTLISASEELVRVRSSDPTTGFSLGPGVLTLDTRATSLELELVSPPGLPRLVVRVGERVVFGRDLPFAPSALPVGDTLRISLGRDRP